MTVEADGRLRVESEVRDAALFHRFAQGRCGDATVFGVDVTGPGYEIVPDPAGTMPF